MNYFGAFDFFEFDDSLADANLINWNSTQWHGLTEFDSDHVFFELTGSDAVMPPPGMPASGHNGELVLTRGLVGFPKTQCGLPAGPLARVFPVVEYSPSSKAD